MDKQIIEAYSAQPLVKQEIREELQEFFKQNLETRMVYAERALVRMKVGEAMIQDLVEENITLEDANKALEEENKIYRSQHGSINQDYLNQRSMTVSVPTSDREQRKKQKLLKLVTQKLEEGRKEM